MALKIYIFKVRTMSKNKELANSLNVAPLNHHELIQKVIHELEKKPNFSIPDFPLSLLLIHLGASLPRNAQKELLQSKDSQPFLDYVEKCLKKIDEKTWDQLAETLAHRFQIEPEKYKSPKNIRKR